MAKKINLEQNGWQILLKLLLFYFINFFALIRLAGYQISKRSVQFRSVIFSVMAYKSSLEIILSRKFLLEIYFYVFLS